MKTPNSKQNSYLPRANDWGIANVWNESIINKKEREVVARDRLWASELGKPNIELFLKMRGIKATNPPNPRAMRKFEAGNLFEWIVSLILKRAGILKETQKWVEYTYPELLRVTGKIDFIAGGTPDYENYKEKLEALELPEIFMRASEAIIKHLQEKYPEGLADIYFEIKSCSSFIMNSMEKTGRSSRNHRLQLFHYLKAENYPNGKVIYICRDDLRMMEIPVTNPSEVEAEYIKAVTEISEYYAMHKNTPIESFLKKTIVAGEEKTFYVQLAGMPPLEKYVIWDDDMGKFVSNWGVEYSSYLTMLYGFNNQLEFEEAVKPKVGRWNRVLSRMKVGKARLKWLADKGFAETDVQKKKVEGKRNGQYFVKTWTKEDGFGEELLPDEFQRGHEMTPKNLEVIGEMVADGFNPDELLEKFAGIEEEVVEE